MIDGHLKPNLAGFVVDSLPAIKDILDADTGVVDVEPCDNNVDWHGLEWGAIVLPGVQEMKW